MLLLDDIEPSLALFCQDLMLEVTKGLLVKLDEGGHTPLRLG
jgi:hypothetical protein